MPNISETVRQTFTKLSGFLVSSLGYPVQNMEGICPPIFWGKGGKVETPKWEVRGLEIFCAVGAFE